MVKEDLETLKTFYETIERMQQVLVWMNCSQEQDEHELMLARLELGHARMNIDNVIKENSSQSGV